MVENENHRNGGKKGRGRDRLLLVAAVVFAFIVSVGSGWRLWDSGAYEANDVYFRMDSAAVFNDLTGSASGNHERIKAHPLFCLFHLPLGRGMALMMEWTGIPLEMARKFASILLTAGASALSSGLFWMLLTALGVTRARSTLFACLLAVSASHLFFSGIPETWIFSALGTIALALASVRNVPTWKWQIAAVYVFGILTSHAVTVGLFALWRSWNQVGKLTWVTWRRAFVLWGMTLGLTAMLALVQKAIYPRTELFFAPNSVQSQGLWVKFDKIRNKPLETAKILLTHQWLVNVIAPEPVTQFRKPGAMASIEQFKLKHFKNRELAVILWLAMLVVALFGCRSLRNSDFLNKPPSWSLACLLLMSFHFCFHSFFGNDRFLYSCNWTALTLWILACGHQAAIARVPQRWRQSIDKSSLALAAATITAIAWENFGFLSEAQNAWKARQSAGGKPGKVSISQ